MPVERRDILFYLNEVVPMLQMAAGDVSEYVPRSLEGTNLLEVAHTYDLSSGFHDRRERFTALLKIPTSPQGVVFRGVRYSIASEKDFAFFIPEDVMKEVIIAACLREGIRLPRHGHKNVIAENLMVGLRITLNEMTLEIAP